MNILDNVKGSPIRSQRVYCGPTLGWIEAPIMQDTVIGISTAVRPWQSVILYNGPGLIPIIILLPLIKDWLNNSYGSWGIYIKDISGQINEAAYITIQPQAGETIDGLPLYNMIRARSSIYVRPRSDYAGWYSL